MFRFYKGADKVGKWKPTTVETQNAKFAAEHVHFATVLAVSEKPKKGESVSQSAKYQGPFYLDIDSDSIKDSIKALSKTIGLLMANGLTKEHINIWASGKKGFHIVVPMAVFTEDTPVERLPFIYKQMALSFQLPKAVDMTVYSSGKGRMWRLPNKKREDTGTYKVRLTFKEAAEITEEMYYEYISRPRTDPPVAATSKSQLFATMFKFAQKKAEEVKFAAAGNVIIDPIIKKALDGDIPPCLKKLIEYDVDQDAGFNAVSLQVGKGTAAFCPSNKDEVLATFAEKAKGVSYNTVDKRRSHVEVAFTTAVRSSSYTWACASALAVLKDDSCCKECPISFIRNMEDTEAETDESDDVEEDLHTETVIEKVNSTVEIDEVDRSLQAPSKVETSEKEEEATVTSVSNDYWPYCIVNLKEGGDRIPESTEGGEIPYNDEGLMDSVSGYGFTDDKGKFRRVSNFTIKVVKTYKEFVPNLKKDLRVGSSVAVYVEGQYKGLAFMDERSWASKQAFISTFGGISNAAYYGKDDDVQKMKAAIMADGQTGPEVRRVHSCGIHRERVGGTFVMTYVEPNWSVDQYGNQNTYQLSGKIPAAPRLRDYGIVSKGDEKLESVVSSLVKTNLPQNVAQVLGWTVGCILKQHITAFRNEFPLLSLHGEPGSGKTSTAAVFSFLHGVDYQREHSPTNMPSCTPFVIWKAISSSTTVPRLFEEFNKSKMPRTYDQYAEHLKACWNQHSVQRGALSSDKAHGSTTGGANIIDIKLSGPVALCSEQEITMPALVERTIQVRYSQKDKKEFSSSFNWVSGEMALGALNDLSKTLYMEAVCTDVQAVKKMYDEAYSRTPENISDRPRHSFAVVMLGLRFLSNVLNKYEIKAGAEVKVLEDWFSEWLEDNAEYISARKRVSEVDAIIQKLSTIAALSQAKDNMKLLVENEHYVVREGKLIFDIMTCHAIYTRYVVSEGDRTVIGNVQEFRNLLRGENYCLQVNRVEEGLAGGRELAVLSIKGLIAKGINPKGFKGA
jgi:hypothetical protein